MKISHAQSLRDLYAAALQILQDQCEHKESEWMEDHSLGIGHVSVQVKVCSNCEKVLERL